mgnify:CR=1 FL=1
MVEVLKIAESAIDGGIPILVSDFLGLNFIQFVASNVALLDELRVLDLNSPVFQKLIVVIECGIRVGVVLVEQVEQVVGGEGQ